MIGIGETGPRWRRDDENVSVGLWYSKSAGEAQNARRKPIASRRAVAGACREMPRARNPLTPAPSPRTARPPVASASVAIAAPVSAGWRMNGSVTQVPSTRRSVVAASWPSVTHGSRPKRSSKTHRFVTPSIRSRRVAHDRTTGHAWAPVNASPIDVPGTGAPESIEGVWRIGGLYISQTT